MKWGLHLGGGVDSEIAVCQGAVGCFDGHQKFSAKFWVLEAWRSGPAPVNAPSVRAKNKAAAMNASCWINGRLADDQQILQQNLGSSPRGSFPSKRDEGSRTFPRIQRRVNLTK